MVVKHFVVALLVSFGLSLAFWAIFSVFVLKPFLIVSTACALAAAILGALVRRGLLITALLASLIRIAVFFIATSPLGA